MSQNQPENAIIDLAEFFAKNPDYKTPLHYLRILSYILYKELDKLTE